MNIPQGRRPLSGRTHRCMTCHGSMRPPLNRCSLMRVSLGCRFRYSLPQPTPMIALLNVHFSRFGDLERPDHLTTNPGVPLESYRDGFGNWCTRLLAPAGDFVLSTDGVCRDSGALDPVAPGRAARGAGPAVRNPRLPAGQPLLRHGPALSEEAWRLFGTTGPGWARYRRSAITSTERDLRLRPCARHPHSLPDPGGAARGLPRLHPPPSPSAAA